MNEVELYPYSKGNLLEDRNTYFYTPYHGATFLRAWVADRDNALADLPDPIEAPVPTPVAFGVDEEGYETDSLLESLLATLVHGSLAPHSNEIETLLARVVQRFEVAKRLYDRYTSDWKAVPDTTYGKLERYVRFGEVMDAAYEVTEALPFLNALLKVNDTLVALRTGLESGPAARLARLIRREQRYVDGLAARRGVNW